jgi:hypothetical protein
MLATAIFLLAPVSLNQVAKADFKVVREVVIAPKGGRTEGLANQKIQLIGPGQGSYVPGALPYRAGDDL